MKYQVSRTSYLFEDKAPCEEAVLVNENDLKSGRAYRPIYEIEINTIEELTSFIDKYGRVVVGYGWIEIYDDYRE